MAEDPFAPVEVKQEGPFITVGIKSGGAFTDNLTQIRGTIPEVGKVLKVDTEAADNPVWSIMLRANDLARAIQADEAKKQGKA